MTMATAGADGDPWVSPVYFAAGDRDGLLWLSEPGTRHSLNIAARPRIAVVIFDSRVAIGEAQALYGSGEAAEVAGEQLETAIAAFSRGSQADGAGAWSVEEVTAPARLRLYRAAITSWSVLDSLGDSREGDRRTQVTL